GQTSRLGEEDVETKATLRLLELFRHHGENQTAEHWQNFVSKFYATNGSLKYILINPRSNETKEYEIAATSLSRLYGGSTSGIKEMKMTLDKAVVLISRAPPIVECSRVVMSGPLNVEFTSDYKIMKFSFTVSDLVELMLRPKGDVLSSPNPDIKSDPKKKPNTKRSSTISKTASADATENTVNEFGVTNTIMQMLEAAQNRQPTVKLEANATLQQGSQTSAVMPPPSQPAAYGGIMLNDMPHFHSGLMTPTGGMKRRFSGVAGGGGTIAPSSIQSASSENIFTTGTNSSMDYRSSARLNTQSGQPTGSYQSSRIVGSPAPLPSPSIASAVATSAIVSMSPVLSTPAKGAKKARNPSVTSITGNTTKGSAAGSMSTTNTGRSRKNTGKKESIARRKESVAEEVEAATSTTSLTVPTTPSSTANAESPSILSSSITKSRAAMAIGSPVSIPSPAITPLISTAIRVNQGEVDALDFVDIPSNFDSISESDKSTLMSSDASWSIDAVNLISSSNFGQMEGVVDDDHMKYINEQLFDYGDQEGNSLTGSMPISSLDGMTIPSNSSILSTMSLNSATG
ncbi:hypothetical protein BGZ79_002735, partial [Entomortierella chlamydospora]